MIFSLETELRVSAYGAAFQPVTLEGEIWLLAPGLLVTTGQGPGAHLLWEDSWQP